MTAISRRARTLAELEAEGWVTNEWSTWQQGECYTYALCLMQENPVLRLGMLMDGWHWFAHDGEYAWDSAGRHKLPYLGLGSPYDEFGEIMRCELDERLVYREHFDDGPDPDYVDAALTHIRRHNILTHQGV